MSGLPAVEAKSPAPPSDAPPGEVRPVTQFPWGRVIIAVFVALIVLIIGGVVYGTLMETQSMSGY